MTDNITDVRAEIASAEAALRRARARLIELEKAGRQYPPEPNESLVTFNIRFNITGVTYLYAAVRANGRWYSTGGERFDSWRDLIDWIRQSNAPAQTRIWVHQGGTTAFSLDTP